MIYSSSNKVASTTNKIAMMSAWNANVMKSTIIKLKTESLDTVIELNSFTQWSPIAHRENLLYYMSSSYSIFHPRQLISDLMHWHCSASVEKSVFGRTLNPGSLQQHRIAEQIGTNNYTNLAPLKREALSMYSIIMYLLENTNCLQHTS